MRLAALRLLRRLALAALAAALLLLGGPPAARELGLVGPSAREEIDEARRAIAVAAEYGASQRLGAYREAVEALALAERRAAAGDRRGARRAARDGRAGGIEAQRLTLAAREEDRRLARGAVLEVGERLDELERLHASLGSGLDAEQRSGLTTVLKRARRQGAGLSLAFEEGEFERVLEARHRVLEALESARVTLSKAREGQAGSGG